MFISVLLEEIKSANFRLLARLLEDFLWECNVSQPKNNDLISGLRPSEPVKIKVEPGLFEYKMWHESRGLAPFMTPREFYLGGYNVDLK